MRLDSLLIEKNIFSSKTQASKYVALSAVKVNGAVIVSPDFNVRRSDKIELVKPNTYVSRAALKLEAANQLFKVKFKGAFVLDVGSSTGGFTDYSLKNGAKGVIAVELGSGQMDSTLRSNPAVELHEKTDIREMNKSELTFEPDIVVIDLSFISLRNVLPHIRSLVKLDTKMLILVKPQFEVGSKDKNSGIVKNQKIRRQILKDFETWLKANKFVVRNKIDSSVHGLKGNIERFYLLKVS